MMRMMRMMKRGAERSMMKWGKRSLFTDISEKGTHSLTGRVWDAIVVGGGHNGLTAAAYLSQAGFQVLVLERRPVLGGAAVTEEIVPGFKFSRASYVQSLLRPVIIRELDLQKQGLKLLPRNPSSFTPTMDGRYLLLGPDAAFNVAEISKFSKKDALAFPRYEKMLEKFCEFMDPLLDIAPPETDVKASSLRKKLHGAFNKTSFWTKIFQRSAAMGQKDMVEFMELLLAPASKMLNSWFESDILKATLATDAVIGAMTSVHTPGSSYVLLHHVMGETNGCRGIWSYVEGGMGAVSSAIAKAAVAHGATLVTNAEVSQLLVQQSSDGQGIVTGVRLMDGTEVMARTVLSNATPDITFLKLMPEKVLPEDFVDKIKLINYESGTTKINVAVDKLPIFSACPHGARADPGPEHFGTIHLGADSMDDIDRAYVDAINGFASRRPIIEMTIPSALDQTISPPGKHVINLFIQYTPYELKHGSWQDKKTRDDFAKKCFDMIDEYAPGFSSSIVGYEMLTPPDLERIFGLTGGNIFHGAMGLDSLFLLRPLKRWSGYRSPIGGLYMCGAGAHPGGGVMGAPGRNAAKIVTEDLRRTD